MADEMADEMGDWFVDCNEDIAPNMVELKFAEPDADGVFSYTAYLPPEIARDIAQALENQANWIDGGDE